jgi:hypothetical protein
MRYKRKIDSVKTSEQFREYLSSKNPRSKKMLEVYDELTIRNDVRFFEDPDFVCFFKQKMPSAETEASPPYLIASRKIGDNGRVYIDTGYIEINEKGEVLPNRFPLVSEGNLFECIQGGINGFEKLKLEVDKAIEIYKQIFGH